MKYGLVTNKLFVWYQVRMCFWLFCLFRVLQINKSASIEYRIEPLRSWVSSPCSQHAPTWQKHTEAFYQKAFLHYLSSSDPNTPNTKQLWGCAAAKVGPSMAAAMGKHFVWIGRLKWLRERFQSFNGRRKNTRRSNITSVWSQRCPNSDLEMKSAFFRQKWLGNKDGFISVLTYCSLTHEEITTTSL